MYTPQLNPALVGRLYVVCQELGIPMTAFANGALERVVRCAEEYLVMEERARVLELIGVERAPARTKATPRPAVAAG